MEQFIKLYITCNFYESYTKLLCRSAARRK
nr:MAG TPA: hypothetical protein [Caudoviricetes sp.]